MGLVSQEIEFSEKDLFNNSVSVSFDTQTNVHLHFSFPFTWVSLFVFLFFSPLFNAVSDPKYSWAYQQARENKCCRRSLNMSSLQSIDLPLWTCPFFSSCTINSTLRCGCLSLCKMRHIFILSSYVMSNLF